MMPSWSQKHYALNSAIGVLGCGWLGLPLAKALLAENRIVYGSTTSQEKLAALKKEGIVPFKIILGEDKIQGPIEEFLRPLDILVINVPPKLRSGNSENYVRKMQLLQAKVMAFKVRKLIFVSSTSVYGNIEGEVTEESLAQPVTASGEQLLAAENIFRKAELRTAILRFGGLIGPKRHPVTYLAGKENLENGDDPINLIHLDDCISMILFILNNDYFNEVYNGVYPDHPRKADYYTHEAQKRGLSVPKYVFKKSKNKGKRIKSRNFLNKKYCFSTPLT